MSEIPLAQQLFAAQLAYQKLEDRISMQIMVLASDWYDDFTVDYYDDSIEIYGVIPQDALRDMMFKCGFLRVWMHPHPAPRGDCTCPCSLKGAYDPGESHYADAAYRCTRCGSSELQSHGIGCEVFRHSCKTCGADPA